MYPQNNMIPQRSVCEDSQGTLPSCAPLAVPYVPFQQTGSKKYSQSDALNNGTIFPGLNLPFHAKPVGGNVVNGPLAELQALEFVLLELGLYLDTHQNDSEAFELYRQYSAMEAAAREQYEAANGPLLKRSIQHSDHYSWLSGPWPWEYREGRDA